MNFDIIIQARFKSSRLPGKILLDFDKSSFLEFLIKNLKKLKKINKIIICSPNDEYKEIFEIICKKNKVYSYIPKDTDENDVLKRYYETAKFYKSSNIIRITSDCPFVNLEMINLMIKNYIKKKLDFLSNNNPRFVPHGFDCEIFSFENLKKANFMGKSKRDREHVSPYIKKNYKGKKNYIQIYKKDFSNLRLTLDYVSDYIFFKKNAKLLKRLPNELNPIKIFKQLQSHL